MNAFRVILFGFSLIFMLAGSSRADQHEPVLPLPKTDKEGLYIQDWFYNSSLNIREDMKIAKEEGKTLVIFWEQQDCSYCKSTHEINLRIPKIINKITSNYKVVRLNIWGNRKITALDGRITEEKELALANNISFTPTVQFLNGSVEPSGTGKLADLEVFRFEGYFKPFHFYFFFHYVLSKGYDSEPNFQRWLGDIGRALGDEGIAYDIWADALPVALPEQY